MNPYLRDADVTLYCGDALEVLRSLPDESVHMVCCSPPFYGLRDYGTGRWEGGDPDCDHLRPPGGGTKASGLANYDNGLSQDTIDAKVEQRRQGYASRCGKCGATRVDQQIGLETTPDEWVAALVDVFREVRRVLRSDGTFWLEIGDSYASKARGSDAGWDKSRLTNPRGTQKAQAASLRDMGERHRGKRSGIKEKELMGTPWLLAFALSADGWYLRSEIIWAKPNPMPESVSDRPTVSHSRVFLFAKSGQPTYWTHRDGLGARSKPKPDWRWVDAITGDERGEEPKGDWRAEQTPEGGRRWRRINLWGAEDYFYDAEAIREPHQPDGRVVTGRTSAKGTHENHQLDEGERRERWPGSGRNRRSVWTIPTEPYPEAHFATWPTKLVEPMILAGTSERGVCPDCGAPWERTLAEAGQVSARGGRRKHADVRERQGASGALATGVYAVHETVGWQPTCDCAPAPDLPAVVPAVVLDPFAGAGTTCLVARKLGRHAIGIDLSADYLDLAARRLAQQSLFADVGEPDLQITVDEAIEDAA